MRYTIHHVNDPHPATFIKNRAPIAPSLYSAADDAYMTYTRTPYAVAAYYEGRIIGVFRYRVNGTQLQASGSAVAKAFRGRGIAQRLWAAAIRRHQPTSVAVTVVSEGGFRLVQHVRQEHRGSGIRFYLTDDRDA